MKLDPRDNEAILKFVHDWNAAHPNKIDINNGFENYCKTAKIDCIRLGFPDYQSISA